MSTEPKLKRHYRNLKNNRIYEVIMMNKMKIGDSDWVDGVTYVCVGDLKIYTRDIDYFIRKFVSIDTTEVDFYLEKAKVMFNTPEPTADERMKAKSKYFVDNFTMPAPAMKLEKPSDIDMMRSLFLAHMKVPAVDIRGVIIPSYSDLESRVYTAKDKDSDLILGVDVGKVGDKTTAIMASKEKDGTITVLKAAYDEKGVQGLIDEMNDLIKKKFGLSKNVEK